MPRSLLRLVLPLFVFFAVVLASLAFAAPPSDDSDSTIESATTTAQHNGNEQSEVKEKQSALLNRGVDNEPVVMARIGNAVITVKDFMNFLALNPSQVRLATTTEGKAELLRDAIENRLLIAAMLQEGLVKEGADEVELQDAYLKLAEKYFPKPDIPNEQLLRAYYNENIDAFSTPASVRISQIQIRVPDNATDAQLKMARSKAEAALSRLEAGESFSAVAAEFTDHPKGKMNQGDLGFVWKNGWEWLEQALEGLEVGQRTEILRSPVGYDILLLTDERQEVITPFEDARDSIVALYQKESQAAARENYLNQLVELVGVTLELEELRKAYPNGLFAD